jgi:divinyl protochlorophyllide a 8-vinyl-reductase
MSAQRLPHVPLAEPWLPEAEARSLDLAARLAEETAAEGACCSAAAVGTEAAAIETAATEARIGPNALIQVAEALTADLGEGAARLHFAGAGLAHRFAAPPSEMVPEGEAIRLHAHLHAALGAEAHHVAREAGRRTADYLLANRIPKPAQAVLKILPARLSARLLLAAIGKHAWTFAGSGRFAATPGRPVRFEIAACPLCREIAATPAPVCDYYAATFERLFRVLVAGNAVARETHCQAAGAEACRFEVRY